MCLDLSKCSSLNDIARQIFGKANYYNREKCKKILLKEGIDWKEFINKQKQKNKRYCLVCNKEIPRTKSKKQKFCSSSCAAKYNNSNRVLSEQTRRKISEALQKRNKKFNGSLKPLSEKSQRAIRRIFEDEKGVCKVCGKELANKRNIYCCEQCHQIDMYNEYIESWQQGDENGLTGEYGISKRIRRYLFEKYDNKCQICGWGEVNSFTQTVPLEIHHIEGDYTNNKEENLQLLCPNCHSLTETHKSHNKNGRKGRRKYYK